MTKEIKKTDSQKIPQLVRARKSPASEIGGPTMTQQNFQKECDVNEIMKKYKAQGIVTHVNERQPYFGDVSSAQEYQSAIHTAMKAQEAFEGMPAATRKRFNNDPAQFLEFVGNPTNQEEAVRLGLVNPPKKEEVPLAPAQTGKKPSPKKEEE